MANITNLNFLKVGNQWKCNFTSPGECVVQIMRKTNNVLKIVASIPSMKPVTIYERGASQSKGEDNILLRVEMPKDIEISIMSDSEVISAKIMMIGD